MKKNKVDAQKLKENAKATIEKYLNDLIESEDDEDTKKASNLSYWIKHYIYYLNQEKTYNPKYQKNYKRGDIVKVNLGYNIGCEEGGLHYAVVINNPNKNSGVVTIIPLSSIKSGKKLHYTEVNLGDTLYQKILIKLNTKMEMLKEQINSATTDDQVEEIEKKLREIRSDIDQIQKMKKGSVALVEQITTVSKQRIVTPTKKDKFLSKIKLSDEELDLIDEKIKKLYTK